LRFLVISELDGRNVNRGPMEPEKKVVRGAGIGVLVTCGRNWYGLAIRREGTIPYH
jgi:hypothetical protein